VNPNPPLDSSDPSGPKRPTRQIDQAFEEVARLSGTDLPPTNYFQEFLEKVLNGIESPAGAIWLRNVQGFLQLQCQVNIDGVGLDKHKNGRQSHNELLRQAFQTAKPILLEPFGSTGILEGIPAGNPTDFVVLLAPILVDEKTAFGLLEVWQDPRWDAKMKRVHLNYIVQMAGYASTYLRNQQGRQAINQEQLWNQLESFSCQIHSSLDITTVSYQVANEGRRLIGCDRLSVATREGKSGKIEAVSGADVVEKRATQIKLMRKLAEAVFKWDEKLVYRGVKDDGLPPDVYEALDLYLNESAAKLLIVQPLRDPREKDPDTKEYRPGKARSALIMECYEPPAQPEPLFARLDVISRHAASALYNSTEMKKIPLGLLWRPILKLQEGLGGRTKFLTYLITSIVVAVVLALWLIPWELKMDAKGAALPKARITMYPSRPGIVEDVVVDRDQLFGPNQVLLRVYDNELAKEITELDGKIKRSTILVEALEKEIAGGNPAGKDEANRERIKAMNELSMSNLERERLIRVFNAIADQPGRFNLMSPDFDLAQARGQAPKWMILEGKDFKSELHGRPVKPSDGVFRIGEVSGEWEIEIRIPQKHIGQVLDAYKTSSPNEELDVDLKLESRPTLTFRGKLARRKISPEATPNKDDHNETEPVVYAYVRISGDDIPESLRIPRSQYLTGVEVRANIRCGTHSMGYSLFYGVVEFVHQKIFQFF
jgi:hypothetical protein